MTKPEPTFTQDSAGGYIVELGGHSVGHVAKVGRIWVAKLGDFNLGEHKSRAEAVEAMIEVYTT